MVKDELDDVQKKAGIDAISYATWDDTLGLELKSFKPLVPKALKT